MAKVSHSNPSLDNVLGQDSKSRQKNKTYRESPYHDSPWADDDDSDDSGLDESNWNDFGNN
jgi:hypothetical protein